MIRRSILRAASEGPFEGEVPAERLKAWMSQFPANVVRRMTRLGLMLGAAMKDFTVQEDDAVIYATTFGETVAIARYLESFPTASPLHFQTSIHPSAIEQVLINRTCPVRELTPLAGQPDLSAQAALTALLTPGDRVLLTGGEEIGSWMRQLDAASAVGFAFALELGSPGESPHNHGTAALGELIWEETSPATNGHPHTGSSTAEGAPRDLLALFNAVSTRSSLRLSSPAGGEIRLTWF